MAKKQPKIEEEETRLRLIYENFERESLSDCVKRAKKGQK